MAEALMTLQYEGDALDAGTMEVRQLAPALLAAGEAIRHAHALLGIPGPAPQVEVQATRPGSFVVDNIVADLPLLRRAIDLLASTGPTAAANLTGLVGAVVTSFSAVKRMRGRKIAATEQVEPGAIRLTLEDGTTFVTSPEALQLAQDLAYRRSVRKVIEPVTEDQGIRSLTVSTDTQSETVAVADVPAFEIPALIEEDLGGSESEVVLRPVNVAFTEGNKWRFNDGESTFHASIEDAGFLGAVEEGSERFAKNDLLRVRLRIRQTRDAEGTLHTERAVTSVLRHLRAPVGIQLALFTDMGDAAGGTPDSEGSTEGGSETSAKPEATPE
jgi:hypothetical protein